MKRCWSSGKALIMADRTVANRGEDLCFARHKRVLLAHDEAARRFQPRRAGFDGPPFTPPFLQSSIQHGCVIEAEHAEEPPYPRRPVDILGAVEHDAIAVTDAMGGHHRGKLRGSRRHQRHRMVRIGKLAQHVHKLRPGDVSALKVGATRANLKHCHRVEGDVDRAIENTEIGSPEMRRQPFGFDQELGMGKIFRRCCHVPALRSASGDFAHQALIQSEKSRLLRSPHPTNET